MQIFANPECTEYADGSTMPVYARVNVPWGVDGGWQIFSPDVPGSCIACISPFDVPGDPYLINLWIDFQSDDYSGPFTAGQVVEINGDESMLPVSNPTVVFTKP